VELRGRALGGDCEDRVGGGAMGRFIGGFLGQLAWLCGESRLG